MILLLFYLALLIVLPGFLISCRWKNISLIERILISLPLGSLLVTLTAYAVSSFELPVINRVTLVLFLLIVVMFAFVLNKRNLNIIKIRRRDIRDFAVVIMLIVTAYLVYGHLLNTFNIPETDASGYLERALFVSESIENHNFIQLWYPKAQLGYPAYTFDTFIFYFVYGIIAFMAGIQAENLIVLFNTLLFTYLSWFFISSYVLFKKITRSWQLGALASLSLISLPVITILSLFSGNIKIYSAYAIVPFTIAYSFTNWSISLMGLLLTYTAISHTSLLLPVVFLIALCTKPVKLLKATALTAASTAFFAIPFIVYDKYTTKVASESSEILPLLLQYFKEPKIMLDFNYGILLGLIFLAGILIITIKKSWNKQIAAILLTAVFLYLGVNLPLLGNVLVDIHKFDPFFALAALSTAFYGLSKLSGKKSIILAVILAALFLMHYAPKTENRVQNFVSIDALHKNLRNPLFPAFPEGRLTSFGVFAPYISHSTIISSAETVSYGYSQGQHASVWQKRLNNASQLSPYVWSTGDYLYNILLLTNTRYAWVNDCKEGGRFVTELLSNCTFCEVSSARAAETGNCSLSLFEFPQAHYATTIDVLSGNEIEDEDDFYLKGEKWDTIIIDGLNKSEKTVFKKLEYEKTPNEIRVFGALKNTWVLVKEQYFPRWSVYVEGKKAPLFRERLGMMTFHVKEGSYATLKYGLFWWEKALVITSFIILLFSLHPDAARIFSRRSGISQKRE